MLRTSLALLGLVCALGLSAQTPSQRETVLVSATVSTSPAAITLSWQAFSGSTGFTIYRKPKSGTTWTSLGTAGGSSTQYADNTAVVGEYYEYKVVRAASAGTGYGYIAAGINVPVVDARGKMVLLVDNTFTSSLSAQLTQLVTDLRADGWVVLRHDVDRSASTSSIRSIVQSDYNADPTNVKAVFVFGHVPVPYSGQLNPDGHGDHLGAWPADGYYGEMNGSWTDNSVNSTGASDTRNRNVPGDGKFDQSTYPNAVELQVGRVDLNNMESFQYYAGLDEQALLSNYLTKLHNYKTKQFTPQFRGAVFDNFEDVGNALAASGYRSVSANVGYANTSDLNGNGAAFSTYINNQSYLWTYSCGGGTWVSASNVCSTGEYAQNVIMGGVFNMCMGSYFGDWDCQSNFLRAPLCSGNGLTNCYAGLPYWWMHHMGMGDNIGYSTVVSMNNDGSVYTPANSGWQGGTTNRVHMGLMGDPSLRQVMVNMPSNLQVTNSGGLANFSWTAATGSPAGYHIYDMGATSTSIPVRVTSNMVTGTTFSSPTVPFIAGRQYMVRAVKLETSATGTYYNMSLGTFGTASGQAAPDCLGVVGGPATIGSSCNDNNACTINDVYNASCQCAGTNAGDTDGDGVCNGSDNCPNVAGQQGSSCNDNNACTINDVLNASCQCVGTNSPDSDGDGICNTQDNCPSVAGQQGSSCSDGNACTINDVLNASCQCVGTASPDSDGDGVCNAQDNCPNVAGQIGSACNDGNACTTNDVLNASCQCAGTASADSDGDGICNAQDNCPNTFGQIGSACNDGFVCTINDVLNSNCQCAGTNSGDTDGDGICNAQDDCPTVPGVVGYQCNDNNACTINDALNASCQCAGTFSDSDGDGICNAQDNCPNVAGQVGSACNDGNAQTVNDALNASCQCVGSTVDCNDNDPCTADSYNGGCVHTALPDSDGDGACDGIDGCPNDANKLAPGICGCGVSDMDADNDGVADCNDGCPNDAGKVSPGQCGCGVNDVDGDSDGTADCNDGCPSDASKTSPGTCGCGVSDADSDSDGTADCNDGCPSDPNKTSPGICGCGLPEGNCTDCAGVLFGTAAIDQCGVCAGGTTGISPNESCQDCAGVPNGAAAVDQCGVCAGGSTGITPNSSCTDCLGTPNGNALPGTACDDSNANTTGDTWSASCSCEGLLIDCTGNPGGSVLPGTACDDGDDGTQDDVYGSDCVCAGTPIPIDCNGDANGTAAVDQCGVCAGGNTGITPNSSCADCLGTPNGTALPGTACDDGDSNTIDDLYGSDCACAGTPVVFDCLGAPNGSALPGTACDDNNANTGDDTWSAGCTCVGTLIDCEGVVGGEALPGTACDDGNAATANDTYAAGCACIGELIDCAGVPGGTSLPGTSCDDGNADTGNDTWSSDCVCTGATIDCQGDAGGAELPGTPCDDGSASTGNDHWTLNCDCIGQVIDCEGVPGGNAIAGTACDDGNADTENDLYGNNCVCAGTPVVHDCLGVANGPAMPGTSCDDGDFGTGNDVWTSNCLCVGQLIDCVGVIGGSALPGSACNDNNPNTGNDTWNGNCSCVGQMIDCEGVTGGSALPGMPCDDGVNGNGVDLWTIDCDCVGNANFVDCQGTPNGTAMPGTPCDDSNSGTGNDSWNLSCLCVGTPIDCAGVIGGTALLDQCGTCAGGTTGVDPDPDMDQDAVVDCLDNCPSLANGAQNDFDGDEVGDLCDNCAWVANPGQEDSNGNGIGDLCEEIGMAENTATVFNIFPNPTNGHVVITMGSMNVRTIQYFDLSGKLIRSAPFAMRSDVSDLAMGSYVVIALDAEGRPLARTRLVKN